MATIRTTARLATPTYSEALQREENASNNVSISMAPISEVMASLAPKSKSSSKATEVGHKDRPSNPSYIEMDWSILKDKDLKAMKELGYFGDKVKV
jgi:hypothetical protein